MPCRKQDLEWLGLRQHQQRVTAQTAALTACLEMIAFKVKVYEESLAAGSADPIWAPSQADISRHKPAIADRSDQARSR